MPAGQDFIRLEAALTEALTPSVEIHTAINHILKELTALRLHVGDSFSTPEINNGLNTSLLGHFLTLAKDSVSRNRTLDFIQVWYDRYRLITRERGSRIFMTPDFSSVMDPVIEPLIRNLRDDGGIILGQRHPASQYHYQPDDAGKPWSFNTPTLLVLAGANATNPKWGNGFTRDAMELLLDRTEPKDQEQQWQERFHSAYGNLQVVGGVQYPDRIALLYHDLDLHNYQMDKSIENPYRPPYIHKLMREKFLPLISDNFTVDADGTVHGTPLLPAEAKRRMRNMTIFTYSFGGAVLDEIGDALYDAMVTLGYKPRKKGEHGEKDDPGEIDDILRQMVVVTMGNVSHFTNCKARYTGIHLVNKLDPVVRDHSSNLPMVTQQLLRKIRTPSVMMPPNCKASSPLARLDDALFYEQCRRIEIRPLNERNDYVIDLNDTGHQVGDYTEVNTIAGQMIRNVLMNSVNNSIANSVPGIAFKEAPSVQELLEMPPDRDISRPEGKTGNQR